MTLSIAPFMWSGAKAGIPQGPWLSVQSAQCRLWWDAYAGVVDSGSPSYNVTSLTDQKGGSALAAGSLVRDVGPGGVLRATGTLNSLATRTANASFVTAAHTSHFSIVLRGDPGASGYLQSGTLRDSDALGVYLSCQRTAIILTRQLNGGTWWDWSIGFAALPAGRHNFGVSFTRTSGASSTATFYVNGVSVGTDTDTTRDLATGGVVVERLGAASGSKPFGAGHWSVALTDPEHATVHSYFAAVDP